MRKHILAALITSVTTGLAQAEVSLFDFEEASSAYEEAYLNGSMFVGKSRGDDQAQYNFNINTSFDRTISTPDRDLNLRANADGVVSRAGTAGANSEESYTANASVTVDNYFRPGSNGAFWYGGAYVGANDAFDDLTTAASVGIGYGRVTNVTPMAKAIRVVDELVARGALNGKPSKSVYQDVAKIISREDEYRSKYKGEEYELQWISDIESTLVKSGLVNGSLSAAGILKSRDILIDERISTRRHGWKVRAGLGYVGSNFDGLTDKPLLEAGAEYHNPINNRTQLSNETTFQAVLNDGNNGYNLSNTMSLTYEVDDRIDWENAWNLDYARNSLNGDDVTTNALSSTFIYEVSNQLDFTTTARVANVSGSTDMNNPDGTDRALLMGVRYRLR